MGRKSKFTYEQKIEACERSINGKGSYRSIAHELGIDGQVSENQKRFKMNYLHGFRWWQSAKNKLVLR